MKFHFSIWYCVFLAIGLIVGFSSGFDRGQQRVNQPGATDESITLIRPTKAISGRRWILIHAYWEHIPNNSPYYDFYREEPYTGQIELRDNGDDKVLP
jgi:hypothetical protein